MEPIKMAREAAKRTYFRQSDLAHGDHDSGLMDGTQAVRASLLMHSMLQPKLDAKDAAIAELLECLVAALSDPMRLINSESAMNETAALITKHKPCPIEAEKDTVTRFDSVEALMADLNDDTCEHQATPGPCSVCGDMG